MGFRNDIIGGAAALIRAAIKSPNYVTGTSGWTVNKDGSAEFQNVIIRGTINAGSFTGTTFIINSSGIFFYAGTPASGNLVASIATVAGSDSFGNSYPSGEAIGLNGQGQIQLQPNVNQAFDISTAITGVFTSMAQYYTGDSAQMMPGMFGGMLLGSGTATKMTSVWHSPFGTQGAAMLLEAQNDAGTDNPVITLGTVTMPDGMTMVFVPIMTLTPFALVLYSAGGSQVSVTKTSGSGTISIPVGVTTAKAECWGAGGGGGFGGNGADSGGGGGGGAEYAAEPSLTVTSGGTVSYSVGAAGAGGTGTGFGGAGGQSTLTGTSVTVTAHGGAGGKDGLSGSAAGGAAGTGSTNTTHHSGGAGGSENSFTSAGGAGGGSSGGVSAAGNAGSGAPGTTGGNGGAAVAGGGAGGVGGTATGCVDGQTRIFTRRGWLHYTELVDGDEAMTLNLTDSIREWALIERVNIHPGKWKMTELTGDGLSACANSEHRWLVSTEGEWVYRTTADLQPSDLIMLETSQFVRFGSLTATEVELDEPIWCPTTANGNWLAQRDGTEYFIGNKP